MTYDYASGYESEYPSGDPSSGAPEPVNLGTIDARGTIRIDGRVVPLAHWGLRMISGLVDYGPAFWLMNVLSGATGGQPHLEYNPATGLWEQTGGGAMATAFSDLGWLVFMTIVIANSIVLQGMTGQSLGKRLVGTQLIWVSRGSNGHLHVWLPGIWRTGLRAMFQTLDVVFCFIGFFVPLVSFYRQTWADMLAKTYVLRRPERTLMFRQ